MEESKDGSQPTIHEPNTIRNRSLEASDTETQPRPTQSPQKPALAKHDQLVGGDGHLLGFMCTRNNILIDGCDEKKTKAAAQIDESSEKLIEFAKDPQRSPIKGMTRSGYEERLFLIRRALCKVNRTLRFPDESQDLAII